MALQKCKTCHKQFNVEPVERLVQSHIGPSVSTITFPNQVVQCIHCWQHYAIVMQLGRGGVIQMAMMPVPSPTGVDTPPEPQIEIARA